MVRGNDESGKHADLLPRPLQMRSTNPICTFRCVRTVSRINHLEPKATEPTTLDGWTLRLQKTRRVDVDSQDAGPETEPLFETEDEPHVALDGDSIDMAEQLSEAWQDRDDQELEPQRRRKPAALLVSAIVHVGVLLAASSDWVAGS